MALNCTSYPYIKSIAELVCMQFSFAIRERQMFTRDFYVCKYYFTASSLGFFGIKQKQNKIKYDLHLGIDLKIVIHVCLLVDNSVSS